MKLCLTHPIPFGLPFGALAFPLCGRGPSPTEIWTIPFLSRETAAFSEGPSMLTRMRACRSKR